VTILDAPTLSELQARGRIGELCAGEAVAVEARGSYMLVGCDDGKLATVRLPRTR